jgi:hypothetical protein
MNATQKESLCFYICLLPHVAPIVTYPFFPTMDGPAHLYNANILNHLWAGDAPLLHSFFQTHTFWIPNWTGHILLSVFLQIFPPWAAEKALLLLYAAGMPIAFRQLIVRITPSAHFGAWLMLPFVYNYLFCLGFYNLGLSFIAFFAALGCWHNYLMTPNTRRLWVVGIWVIVTYFSHPFTFVLLIFSLFLQVLGASGYSFRSFLYFMRPYLLIAIPPTVLLLQFYMNQSFPGGRQHLDPATLWKHLADVRPLICYHYEKEQELTQWLFGLYILLTGNVLYRNYQLVASARPFKLSNLRLPGAPWISMAGLTLFLLFVVPDNASAGMMSDRLMLLFFIFWTLWLALQHYPKWLRNISLGVVLIVHFALILRYMQVVKRQNELVDHCRQAATYIAPNSVVLSLYYHENWLAPHFSNYLGVEKPMVILENYEADTGWFPVRWRNDRPDIAVPDARNTDCLPFKNKSSAHLTVPVDYVFILGNAPADVPCAEEMAIRTKRHFTLVYHSAANDVRLYRRNF